MDQWRLVSSCCREISTSSLGRSRRSKPSHVMVEEDGADLAERGEVPEVTVTTPPSPPGPTWHCHHICEKSAKKFSFWQRAAAGITWNLQRRRPSTTMKARQAREASRMNTVCRETELVRA